MVRSIAACTALALHLSACGGGGSSSGSTPTAAEIEQVQLDTADVMLWLLRVQFLGPAKAFVAALVIETTDCPGGGKIEKDDAGRTQFDACTSEDGSVLQGGFVLDDDGVAYDTLVMTRSDGDVITLIGGYVWDTSPATGQRELIAGMQVTVQWADGASDLIMSVTGGTHLDGEGRVFGKLVFTSNVADDVDAEIQKSTLECTFDGLPLADLVAWGTSDSAGVQIAAQHCTTLGEGVRDPVALPRCPPEIVFHDGQRYTIGFDQPIENFDGNCLERTGGDDCAFEVSWYCNYSSPSQHQHLMDVNLTRTSDTPTRSCGDAVSEYFAINPYNADNSVFSASHHVLIAYPGPPAGTLPAEREAYLEDLRVAAETYIEVLEPFAHRCD